MRLTRAGYRAMELPKPYYVYSMADEGMLLSRAVAPPRAALAGYSPKHADLYRPRSVLRLWRATRDGSGRVSLHKGMAALLLAAVLPDALFSRLVAGMRRRSLLEGRRPAYIAEPEKTRFAA